MTLLRFVLVAALALPFATVARAQSPAPATPATPATSDVDPATQAKEHFAAGTRAYNLGEFALALSEYKTAYKLNPLPAFLFNIGQCHYALGEYDRAIFFYEGFIRESPSSEHRARVEGFIAEARRRQDEKAASAPVTTTPPTTTTAPTTTPSVVTPEPAHTTPPLSEPEPEPGITDAGWFWPSVAGAAVVVAAATTVVVIAALNSKPGTLEPIDVSSP